MLLVGTELQIIRAVEILVFTKYWTIRRHLQAQAQPPSGRVQAQVQLPSGRDNHEVFTGELKDSREGMDIVAIFDGTQIRLELLSATMSLKCVTPTTFRPGLSERTAPLATWTRVPPCTPTHAAE